MKPVLVDTSVWRRYFAGHESVRPLADLLEEEDTVLVHPFILGELVLGGLSPREESLMTRLPSTEVVPHDEVLAMVRRRRLTRRGIGWVDAHLLASTFTSSALLWSSDADLQATAGEFGVAFRS